MIKQLLFLLLKALEVLFQLLTLSLTLGYFAYCAKHRGFYGWSGFFNRHNLVWCRRCFVLHEHGAKPHLHEVFR